VNSSRHALALAAVLAATVLTGGAAILGLSHRTQPGANAPAAALVAQPASPVGHWEEGD
jgi:hypothetical protein